MADRERFDREALLRRLDGDTALAAEIAALFLEHYPDRLADLRQAIDEGRPQAVERAAHSLRGALLTVAADGVARRLRELEDLGRAGRLEPAAAALARIEDELEGLALELRCL
jgi:HPt (histidine-containing phosphotransfer) domain-containing protein